MSTNNETPESLKLKYYKDRGVLKKEIRSYEVSLWTLQDSFITVLKWSDIEQKGRIEKPKMKLGIDGTQELTFNIPMYIYRNGKKIENPNWYNITNGNLIANMRKVKVIFHKGEPFERVYEFLIMSVKENHEKDILTCEVKCEGLAFHELGKVGYIYSLSQDLYEDYYYNYITENPNSTPRIANIDYWCEEIDLVKFPSNAQARKSNVWYYDVRMTYDRHEGILNQARSSSKVYEESYVNGWKEQNGKLVPAGVESYTEKARMISSENSNKYNITQTIAKNFGVFCRYEYGYDENYHIISRCVVFYNNFSEEARGYLSLSYPHSSKKVTRTQDSSNLTTKLFVKNVDDDTVYSGYHSIMNVSANKSMENYILNFDYLHDMGTITDDQYNSIPDYEKQMRDYNIQLTKYQNNLAAYQEQIPELEGKVASLKKAIDTTTELISQKNRLKNALDEDYLEIEDPDGYITVSEASPDIKQILTEEPDHYIKLEDAGKGIDTSSIVIGISYNTSTQKITDTLTDFIPIYDDDGNLIRLKVAQSSGTVYLTYKYNPKMYYDKVITALTTKLKQDEEKLSNNSDILGTKDETTGAGISGLYLRETEARTQIKSLMSDQKTARLEFERLMGPALREGYWQPEDYVWRGQALESTKILTSSITNNALIADSDTDMIVNWDIELFDEEDDLFYYSGIDQQKVYYPLIDISGLGVTSDHSFIFNSNVIDSTIDSTKAKNLQIYKVGSKALIRYVKNKNNNTVFPALVLTGAKKLTDSELARVESTGWLAKVTTTVSDGNATLTFASEITLSASKFLTGSDYVVVYPRIKFSSLALKTEADNFMLRYNNVLLERFVDYRINTRTTERDSNYYPEYFVTIKPETIYKYGLNHSFTANYILSNADSAIYVDALEVSKENAKPKVSYEVSPTIINLDLSAELYGALAQIVMINDVELKFEDVFGYISKVELDLDNVQNDSIEVKNYTSKFEDLFSTIIAQTEAMKSLSSGAQMAIAGDVALSETGLAGSIDNNTLVLQAYLDSYFDTSAVVRNRLTELFTEASQILAGANSALYNLYSVSSENAQILANFAENVEKNMSTKVYRQTYKPYYFKVGDIWIKTDTDEKYVAVYDSTNLPEAERRTPTGGFIRTYNGSIAAITGAAVDVDAVAGTVNIKAQNSITMASGGYIDLSSTDINIQGNRSVNIGGTTINIGSVSLDNQSYMGGINLVATQYNTNFSQAAASKVLISPMQIEMAGSKITMLTGTAAGDVSAIELDGSKGIWIGSNKYIRLYSANNAIGTGANVELNPDHLLLGYANLSDQTGASTAIELNDEFVLIAAGKNITGNKSADSSLEVNGTSTGLIGAKFSKDSIGFATQSGSGNNIVYNAIIMNGNGITVGSAKGGYNLATTDSSTLRTYFSDTTKGSYVRIANDGIELGSLADLYINTDNFKLQTHSRDKGNEGYVDGNTLLAIGKGLQSVGYNTTRAQLETLDKSNDVDIRLVLNNVGLYLKGAVSASYFIANGTNTHMKVDGTTFGFYKNNNNNDPILTIDSNGYISASNRLYITASNLYLGTTSNATTMSSQITTFNNAIKAADDKGQQGIDDAAAAASAQLTYANDIARGTITVPHVKSTGIEISGNTLTIGSTGTITMLANSSLTFATPSSNSAFILNSDGVTIASAKNITLASGGVVNLVSSNLTIKSNPGSGENYFYVGESGASPSKYIKYTQSGELEVKGKIVATSLAIGESSAADFVNANVDLSNYYTTSEADSAISTALANYATSASLAGYAQYADFGVQQGSEIPAMITSKVWDTLGNQSGINITTTGIDLYSTGTIYIDSGALNIKSGLFSINGQNINMGGWRIGYEVNPEYATDHNKPEFIYFLEGDNIRIYSRPYNWQNAGIYYSILIGEWAKAAEGSPSTSDWHPTIWIATDGRAWFGDIYTYRNVAPSIDSSIRL